MPMQKTGKGRWVPQIRKREQKRSPPSPKPKRPVPPPKKSYDFGPGDNEIVSVCTVDPSFECVESVVLTAGLTKFEVVISSFEKTKNWNFFDVQPIIESIDVPVSRGLGFNRAAMKSKGSILIFLAPNTIINESAWTTAIATARKGISYFPLIGNDKCYIDCVLPRASLQKVGGWLEFSRWGGEDKAMFNQMKKIGPVKRESDEGFFKIYPNRNAWRNIPLEV